MTTSPKYGIVCKRRARRVANVHLTTEKHNYFNFAERDPARVEAEDHTNTEEKRTSYREDEVDASALEAEEGRGDRRNVQGELHASDEP